MTFRFCTFEKTVFWERVVRLCALFGNKRSVQARGGSEQSMYYRFLRHFDYLKILFVVCQGECAVVKSRESLDAVFSICIVLQSASGSLNL